MPIYEYKCASGHVFDVIQKMSDEPLSVCQECDAPAERVLHPVAIHFKGSGFHNTDYKTKPPANGSSPEKKDSDSSSSSSSKDSKPAATASD